MNRLWSLVFRQAMAELRYATECTVKNMVNKIWVSTRETVLVGNSRNI